MVGEFALPRKKIHLGPWPSESFQKVITHLQESHRDKPLSADKTRELRRPVNSSDKTEAANAAINVKPPSMTWVVVAALAMVAGVMIYFFCLIESKRERSRYQATLPTHELAHCVSNYRTTDLKMDHLNDFRKNLQRLALAEGWSLLRLAGIRGCVDIRGAMSRELPGSRRRRLGVARQ